MVSSPKRAARRRPDRRSGRIPSLLSATLLCALIAGLLGHAPPAAAAGLSIELNKTESNGDSCVGAFIFRNELGHTLDRFSLDLYVFDRQGIIARQVLLDLAPLRNDKTTVANFVLIGRPCDEIGRVLVNDIPSCRAEESGETLDCLNGLTVSSRGEIALVK